MVGPRDVAADVDVLNVCGWYHLTERSVISWPTLQTDMLDAILKALREPVHRKRMKRTQKG